MANVIGRAARAISRILDKLTPEQRDAAIAWALERLGGAAKPKQRRKRRVKTPAPVPAAHKLPAPKAPAAPPARRTVVRKPAVADDDEDDE